MSSSSPPPPATTGIPSSDNFTSSVVYADAQSWLQSHVVPVDPPYASDDDDSYEIALDDVLQYYSVLTYLQHASIPVDPPDVEPQEQDSDDDESDESDGKSVHVVSPQP